LRCELTVSGSALQIVCYLTHQVCIAHDHQPQDLLMSEVSRMSKSWARWSCANRLDVQRNTQLTLSWNIYAIVIAVLEVYFRAVEIND